MATIAVFLSLGGSALAAKHYLITSTSQISPKVLKKLNGATGPKGATGPIGPAGATGVPGATGAAGATGATGMSGYEVVAGNIGSGSGSGFNIADSTASCPAGKKVVGGGFNTTGNNADVCTVYSEPFGTTGWTVRTTKLTISAYSLQARAICVNVAA
jgi:hypothetical protein